MGHLTKSQTTSLPWFIPFASKTEGRTTKKPCVRKRNRTPRLLKDGKDVMQYHQKMNLITGIAVEEKIRKRLDNIIQHAMNLVPIRTEKISS